MKVVVQPIVTRDNLAPKTSLGGYHNSWQEGNLIAHAWLTAIRDQPTTCGFALDCTWNHVQDRTLTARQEQACETLAAKVKGLMLEEMARAGWREVDRGVWQHESRL